MKVSLRLIVEVMEGRDCTVLASHRRRQEPHLSDGRHLQAWKDNRH